MTIRRSFLSILSALFLNILLDTFFVCVCSALWIKELVGNGFTIEEMLAASNYFVRLWFYAAKVNWSWFPGVVHCVALSLQKKNGELNVIIPPKRRSALVIVFYPYVFDNVYTIPHSYIHRIIYIAIFAMHSRLSLQLCAHWKIK